MWYSVPDNAIDNKQDNISERIWSINNELDSLKNSISWLSENEKNQKLSEINETINNCSQSLSELEKSDTQKNYQEELSRLKTKIDSLKSERDKIISDTSKELEDLSKKTEEKWDEKEKWWVRRQRDAMTSKEEWKENTWKNIARAVGFWLTWYAAYRWIKGLWNLISGKKKKKEWSNSKESKSSWKDDDKSFWEKPAWKVIKTTGAILWVWSGVYYLAHWIYTKNWWLKDLFDWEKWKKLEFDAALEYCKWAIANQDNKEGMSHGMNLKYHEETSEIEAYGVRVKIDKKKRIIPWVWLGDVKFKKYEHMINAAILIAFLKKTYSWRCVNNNPFHLTGSRQWDINVSTWNGKQEAVDWTGNWWRIVWVTAGWIAWILAWIFGWLKLWAAVWVSWWVVWYMTGSAIDHNNIMNDHMPELDNEFGKKCLAWYLNNMWCWQARNQWKEDITESPIKNEVWECINKVQSENPMLEPRWDRNFDMIPDPNIPDRYTIKAYWRDMEAEVKWSKWNYTIKILWITWWNPSIKADMTKWNLSSLNLPLKEWIYMSMLVWFLLNDFHHKWNEYPRFTYDWRMLNVFRKNNYWIYFSDSWPDTLVYSKAQFKEKMPTIFGKNNGEDLIKFLNDWITDEFNVSIRKATT